MDSAAGFRPPGPWPAGSEAEGIHAAGAGREKAARESRQVTADLDFSHAMAAFGSAFVAGAINSVAGGGTLITFPTLIWLGLDSVTANATSTVAIWPGSIGAMAGYRRELSATEPRILALVAPSLIGGIA